MIINESSILAKFERYSKTKECQTRMSNYVKELRRSGRLYTSSGFALLSPEKMVEDMEFLRNCILSRASALNAAGELSDVVCDIISDGIITFPRSIGVVNGVEMYECNLNFYDGDVRRESLMGANGRTGNGIDNIVALFNNGVQETKTVFGLWTTHNGDDVFVGKSRNYRRPLKFIQDGVRDFVSLTKGVDVIINEVYEQ